MDCVNHSGVTATAFCQNCGKALCAQCVQHAPNGQILCQPCATAWQSVPNPFIPFAAPPPGAPNPSAAAVLGLIPGVGAMYNGQFFKGFIHVVIFAVLVASARITPFSGCSSPPGCSTSRLRRTTPRGCCYNSTRSHRIIVCR